MVKLATMTSVCPDWTLKEIVEGMSRHGFHGLEPRIGWGHRAGIEPDMPADQRAAARRRLEEAGLAFCCIATGAQFAHSDPVQRQHFLDEARQAIDLAADLGAPYVRTFGGNRGEGELLPAVERTAEAYRQVMDHAEQREVVLLFETHDFWCASAPVRAVVEAVNDPHLGVLWDFMHPQRFCERPAETMANIGHLTRHVHAHDGCHLQDGRLDAGIPLGEGIFDHETPLRLLVEAGYDGWFSVEVIHRPGTPHDADAVLAQYANAFREILSRISA